MPYFIEFTPEILVDVLLTGRRWRAGHIVTGLPRGSTFKHAEVSYPGLTSDPPVSTPLLTMWFEHPDEPANVRIDLDIWTTVAAPDATMHLDDLFEAIRERYGAAHLYIRAERKGEAWAEAPVPDPDTFPQPESVKAAYFHLIDEALAGAVRRPEEGDPMKDLPERPYLTPESPNDQ